jgi:hypothetical protein
MQTLHQLYSIPEELPEELVNWLTHHPPLSIVNREGGSPLVLAEH